MSRKTVAGVAWVLWGLNLVVVVAIIPGSGGAGPRGAIAGAVFILAFATTGALVASRIPDNPIGWLLCLAASAFAVGGVCITLVERAAREGWDHPAVTAAAWIGTYVWILGIGPAATLVLLLFPDGRLPSRRWRPIAWMAGASVAVTVVVLAARPGLIEDTAVVNPFGVNAWASALPAVEAVGLTSLFVSILASCASLIVRYRGAGALQRQQLKWLAWSLPGVLLWLGASIYVDSTQTGDTPSDIANAMSSIGLTIVPVAIGVAILRHRLYDIDLVIKRTLVYGALTAALLATYLALVLLLQLALRPVTRESDLAVAASTLVVAALFRPLRARIQSVVDRRFFRSRYDATRTLEAFAVHLRDELDVETLGTDLRVAVRDAMQPAHVSLWLRRSP